jgi:hypothetical protein
MKKLKTITSHSGLARWLAEVSEPVAYAPRCVTQEIQSPYRYSPSVNVHVWNGKRVVWFEVAHKRYQVFEAPSLTFSSDKDATDYHIANGPKGPPKTWAGMPTGD